jgi:hypothetical protein
MGNFLCTLFSPGLCGGKALDCRSKVGCRATIVPRSCHLRPRRATAITNLIHIIYASRPFGYDEATLAGILLTARTCNERDGVTGALVCRNDIYLQLLEGPESLIVDTYNRIRRDDRHVEMKQLISERITKRMFGKWAMLHDPATTWMWSADEIAAGALDKATPDEIRGVFEALAERQ